MTYQVLDANGTPATATLTISVGAAPTSFHALDDSILHVAVGHVAPPGQNVRRGQHFFSETMFGFVEGGGGDVEAGVLPDAPQPLRDDRQVGRQRVVLVRERLGPAGQELAVAGGDRGQVVRVLDELGHVRVDRGAEDPHVRGQAQ